MSHVINTLLTIRYTGLLSLLNINYKVDLTFRDQILMVMLIPDRDNPKVFYELTAKRCFNPNWTTEEIIREAYIWMEKFLMHELRECFHVSDVRYKEPH